MHLTLTSNIQYEQMAALFDLILCAFLVFDSTKEREESSRRFVALLYFVTIANAAEIMAVIVCSPDLRLPLTLKMLVMSVDYFFNALVAYLFFNYTLASTKANNTFITTLASFNRVVLALEFFLLLSNLFLNNTFFFDDKMVLRHGPYYLPVAFLAPVYFTLISFILFVKYYRKMQARRSVAIFLAFLLNFCGMMLQAYFHGSLLVALPFASLGIYVLYFTIESPDYRQLANTLNDLSVAKRETEEASNAKDAFMTQITHEIRTPMNSIMGLTDMVLQEMDGQDSLPPNKFSKVHQYVHNISNSSHQLIYILDNIQNFIISTDHADGSSYAPAGEAPLQASSADDLQAPNASFLLVDDNEMNLFVAKKLLAKTGAKVTTCDGGLECLRALTEETFDLIFLDYMMPDMDGIEVMDRSRKLVGNKNADTPYIMVTANTVPGMEERAMESGFAGYISKPVDWEQIYNTLLTHLPADKSIHQATDGEFRIQRASDAVAPMELFDTSVGMEYCMNDSEFYREALNVFAEEHEDKAASIRSFREDGNWKLFSVRVHGLKSTARTIGAMQLSTKAKEMEDMGHVLTDTPEDADSLAYVDANLQALLDLYDKTVAAIPQLKL